MFISLVTSLEYGFLAVYLKRIISCKGYIFQAFTYFTDTQTFADTDEAVFSRYIDDIDVQNSYKGVHLTFPLTLNQLHKIVQAFKRKLVSI